MKLKIFHQTILSAVLLYSPMFLDSVCTICNINNFNSFERRLIGRGLRDLTKNIRKIIVFGPKRIHSKNQKFISELIFPFILSK